MKYNFKIILIIIISFQYNQLASMVSSYNEYEDMYSSISPTEDQSIYKHNNETFYEHEADALHHYFSTPAQGTEIKVNSTPDTPSLTDSEYTNNSFYHYLFEEQEEEKKEKISNAAFQATEEAIHPMLLSAINSPDKGMQTAINFILSQPNVNDQNNVTKASPLHFAMKYNAYKLAVILIAAGANVNARDIHGYTPLHTAVIYHYHNDTTNESIKTLLDAGVNAYIKDQEGKTAAKIALELGMTDVYNLIEQSMISRLVS